ncbi:MAG: laminin G domain-containing protein [Kiritimatiellia bacterium]
MEGASSSIPFPLYQRGIFKGADRPAPVWEQDESGRWVLSFDGERGNFLALPATFMPQRAGFTLTFEIRPETTKPEYVLFRHGAQTVGGLTVEIKGGKLTLAYSRRTPDHSELPFCSRLDFKTDLSLLPNKWQRVVVTRDASHLTISVNGRSESFPCEGIGLYLQPSHFGGRGDRLRNGTVPFFKGQLRVLSIQHSAVR